MLPRMQDKNFRILFVCMGNICRSPSAEGVFRQRLASRAMASHIAVDSAGTIAHHVGEPPDRRSQAAARKRGIDLSGLRARQVVAADFMDFDLILAMDRENLKAMQRICPGHLAGKLDLFLNYAPNTEEREVPDPYYGGRDGFEHVLDLVEAASDGLIAALERGTLIRGPSSAKTHAE